MYHAKSLDYYAGTRKKPIRTIWDMSTHNFLTLPPCHLPHRQHWKEERNKQLCVVSAYNFGNSCHLLGSYWKSSPMRNLIESCSGYKVPRTRAVIVKQLLLTPHVTAKSSPTKNWIKSCFRYKARRTRTIMVKDCMSELVLLLTNARSNKYKTAGKI